MEPSFWLERWQRGETGFHQPEVAPGLLQHWLRLAAAPASALAGAPVFVPLCGKSLDMCWLRAQGHRIIGVELSALAIRDFFAGQHLQPERRTVGRLECWEAGGYELYVGDCFDLPATPLAAVRGVYDRAALIALPAPLRARYAAQLCSILPARCQMLLITLDYPQEQMAGPPFAVAEAELRTLYAGSFSLTRLDARDVLAAEPRFRQRGLKRLEECSYLLTRISR
jgi:thiopurine S-methyltransferase